MTNFRRWFHRFAVRGIVWRRYLDFGLANVPFYLRPVMIFFWTILFFFLAAPARRRSGGVETPIDWTLRERMDGLRSGHGRAKGRTVT